MAYRKTKSYRRPAKRRAPAKRAAARRPREQTIKLVLQHQMLAPPTAPLMSSSPLTSPKPKGPKL